MNSLLNYFAYSDYLNTCVSIVGLGYCAVLVSAIIGLYYNVIIGYCFFYFFASMTDPLPWAEDYKWHNASNITGIKGYHLSDFLFRIDKNKINWCAPDKVCSLLFLFIAPYFSDV